ncbi:MAG: hypothetical protein RJB66_1603 [Pseudomonadota bacterium]
MKRSQGGSRLLLNAVTMVISLGGISARAQSAATATSTTPAASALPSKANKISLTLANETANSVQALRTSGGAETVNVMSLAYKHDDKLKLAATLTQRYVFVGNGGEQSTQKPEFFDLSLSAATTYDGILGTEKTPVKYMFNLPTSQRSIESKQAFGLGAEVVLNYDLSEKVSSGVKLVPVWNAKNGISDVIRNQIYTELRYSHTNALSSYGFLDHKVRLATEAYLPKLGEVAALGLGMSYSPLKTLDLDVSVARERHLHNSAKNNQNIEFSFLDDKEIMLTAGAALRF